MTTTSPARPPRATLTHRERWWSAFLAFLGITAAWWAGHVGYGGPPALALVASMGASAVLVFAAPHSPLSQPWNVLGGHLVSAVVGVTCVRVAPDLSLAVLAPAAVALAILATHYLRCLHPPGGATALVAVIGGDAVHALGYEYVMRPVAIDVAALLAVGLATGWLSRPRRYPVSSKPHAVPARAPIDHEDLVYALERLDTHIDVAPDDLLVIYRLATGHHADEEVRGRLARGASPPSPGLADTARRP